MARDIYAAAAATYDGAMRTLRGAHVRISTQLTEHEVAIVRRAKATGAATSLSDAMDRALRGFLARPEIADWVPLPARRGALRKRGYHIDEATSRLLAELAARHGYDQQDLVRAAVFWFGESGATQGPVQTGA